jgi:hypothetical protein
LYCKTSFSNRIAISLQAVRQWSFNVDYQRWDEQIERDIAEGKLDALAEEAISEFKAGQCREI